ncbi:hypothetical protein PF011_g10773 [Phytophthora fragariae]|uniref:Uncharacterized protein n=1 Tax=Phytophthora fragariae TaxID=53985 RepID=A0A6A3KRD6_9STRA|nr:hypothetical protein PF011_g10773 [Phytophthora fragariae]
MNSANVPLPDTPGSKRSTSSNWPMQSTLCAATQSQQEAARSHAAAIAQIEARKTRELEDRLKQVIATSNAEKERYMTEQTKLESLVSHMDDLRQRTEAGHLEQLRALEKLAQQRVANETDMRKADEAKNQYLLQVQRQLQESEAQAQQA